MHTEVLWVPGEERGAEQPGFGQDIKNGLSKPPLKGSGLVSSPILWQHDHTNFLKPSLPAHREPINL